jgi:hypothetical protein
MKTGLFAFIVGIAVGAFGHWFFTTKQGRDNLEQVREEMSTGASKVKQSVQDAVNDINTDDIKEELKKTGTVIREKAKAAGRAIADVTADTRIVAAVKSKFATEANVSALNIKVDSTDGLVTLSGTAKSPDEVAKAVQIALNTEGVHKVVSTIQIAP